MGIAKAAKALQLQHQKTKPLSGIESPLRRQFVHVFVRERKEALEMQHFPPLKNLSQHVAPEWATQDMPLIMIFKSSLYTSSQGARLGLHRCLLAPVNNRYQAPLPSPLPLWGREQPTQLHSTPFWDPQAPAFMPRNLLLGGPAPTKSWLGFPRVGIGVHLES